MPGIISIHFGRLVSVTHKMKIYEGAKDWRDDLVGMSGVIEVIETSHNRQRIVFEINDYATVSTTSGSVEIKDGKLTANTQFIVITHRRGTMNSADRLYGITMQEKGISTLVSVNLVEDELEE